MSKINKIALGLAVAGLLTTGAIAYAADNASTQTTKQTMMQGAVEKGIISQEQADQMHTYQKETMQARHQEMMQNRIDQALEEGTITQEEADQIKSWQDSRPEAMEKLGGMGGKHMNKGEKMENCD